jgi:signal transduction histidine kinase
MLGGIMMSRSTARRAELINQTSQRIIKGNVSLRIPDRGTNDDFDQLARNLNEMLDRIFHLMEGVRHVSDNIAHDLRTPLTRLRNKLEKTMLSVERDEDREQVASAVAEADQLLATFNALLRIARLEGGGRTSNFSDFNLSELVLDAAELYEALAEDKQQTLSIKVKTNIFIYGDKDLLFQTLSNLIDNAIKYTPEGGDIELYLSSNGKDLELTVADSGIGIPEEERAKVFDRFYRVAKSRSQPGNGLGLSLVQAVVELHDGEIRLADNEPGLRIQISLLGKVLDVPELSQSKEAAA